MKGLGPQGGKLLPDSRPRGPMPWVIAIMTFLTVLAAAAAIALGGAANSLEGGTKAVVQIMATHPAQREAEAAAALKVMTSLPGAGPARRIGDDELQAMLEPWLGPAGHEDGVPTPAMIEIEAVPDMARLRAAVKAAAPSARIDAGAEWLAPLHRLVASLRWLAAGLVLLTAGAMAAVVVLAARASLDTHRGTIEVLHLMGATDRQLARLFQRRIAFDVLFGGAAGLVGALAILWLVGQRVKAAASGLIGSVGLPPWGWLALVLIPFFGMMLATLVARIAILGALSRVR